jgi:hypothetical protein
MHEKINYMRISFAATNDDSVQAQYRFLTEHAVDPIKEDISATEGAHHYLDIDHYGRYPFPDLPRDYKSANKNIPKTVYGLMECSLVDTDYDGALTKLSAKRQTGYPENAANWGTTLRCACSLHVCQTTMVS